MKIKRKNNIKISMIAAIALNRALGRDNKLLWNIPEDMKYFMAVTKGHAVIMGRLTFESIGRPLPHRVNIVITKDKLYKASGAVVCHSLEEAVEYGKQKETNEIFIIGGGQIYEQGMRFADRLYLTIVEGTFEADTFFPDYTDFNKIVSKKESKDATYTYTFLTLEKS